MKASCFCEGNVASSGYLMYNTLSGFKGFFNGPAVPIPASRIGSDFAAGQVTKNHRPLRRQERGLLANVDGQRWGLLPQARPRC